VRTRSPRIETLLDKPIDALSSEEIGEVAHALPDEWAVVMVQLKFRPDQPVPFELMDLALELELRYPLTLEHYRARAKERRLLAERLAGSVPFKISAGAHW